MTEPMPEAPNVDPLIVAVTWAVQEVPPGTRYNDAPTELVPPGWYVSCFTGTEDELRAEMTEKGELSPERRIAYLHVQCAAGEPAERILAVQLAAMLNTHNDGGAQAMLADQYIEAMTAADEKERSTGD